MVKGANKQIVTCAHKEEGKVCPISKTPCLGDCIYANILDDISLGIIGLDTLKKEVFFQNKLAVSIFKETIKPKDYGALSSLLLPDLQMPVTLQNLPEPSIIQYGRKFLGYSTYLISETYLWIYISDITEKMRLNSIAEAVNTMNNFGYIFSGIRHELGNPINSIKTSMAVCRKNLQSYSRETISEFIDRVLSDIARVEVLLKDLKNFSMYENPECREVYIASFMDNLLAMVERDFSVNRIRIRTFISPAAERGFFDARALQHVMLNILTNASDALEGVKSPEIAISAFNTGDRIIIGIKDNGKGIPEAQKKHLFQPFSTTKKHGTGLGLVIVKKMMLKMNGTIEIDSRENDGTRVTLNLPAGNKSDA
ncbi:MAG: HAMP domain-containing histidine kinase [Nitrospirota bacterium]|nr:HAMP domain-containing histidine kinase [Nitrospirota bacterium]